MKSMCSIYRICCNKCPLSNKRPLENFQKLCLTVKLTFFVNLEQSLRQLVSWIIIICEIVHAICLTVTLIRALHWWKHGAFITANMVYWIAVKCAFYGHSQWSMQFTESNITSNLKIGQSVVGGRGGRGWVQETNYNPHLQTTSESFTKMTQFED